MSLFFIVSLETKSLVMIMVIGLCMQHRRNSGVIPTKGSAWRDLRTDLTANGIPMRRFFDFTSFRSE